MVKKGDLNEGQQARVKKYEHYKQLFDNELFVEFMGLIQEKELRYLQMAKNAPRVGEIQTAEEKIIQKGEVIGVTIKPFRVSHEDRVSAIEDCTTRANELYLVHTLPKAMERDAKRAKDEAEKMKGEQ